MDKTLKYKIWAILDQWGGDKNGRITCKMRNVSIVKEDGSIITVSDHMWLDGADALKIFNIKSCAQVRYSHTTRPKRGVSFEYNAKIITYSSGKEKFGDISDVKVIPKFKRTGKQVTKMWHGGDK